VEDQQVFALLGYVGTPTAARVLPLLKRYQNTGVVLLFPLTGADLLREPPYSNFVLNLRASYFDETRALVEALLASGRRRIAVFYQADIYGRNGWDGVRRTLRQHNLSIVSEASYKRGVSYAQDFRREAGLISAAIPDAIVTVGTAPACAAFVRDARNSGYTGIIAALSFGDADNLVKFLHAQFRVSGRDYTRDLVFSQVVPSYEDLSLPAVRLYRQVMDKARLGKVAAMLREEYLPHRYSFVSFEGFLASQVLARALARIPGAPTRQGLQEELSRMRGLDIGIGEAVDFAPGSNQGLRRTYLTVYQNGHFEGVATLVPVRAEGQH
jgi:ABC-type branched-subunit amino acid transport system substrate-binding protein